MKSSSAANGGEAAPATGAGGDDNDYLTPEQLKGFDKYKYSSLDTSPISVYIMHPFWNTLVEYVPRWVAPNLMTFVGFVLTALNFVILTFLDYGFVASAEPPVSADVSPLPKWVWLFMGISLFVAYTLDGIDGKQARRTKTSGPLGELFDHGLDSWAASIVPICLYSCFGRIDHSITTWRMYLVLWNIIISFYLTHWEKYNTGILFLPWGYDFGMISSAFVFIVTGIWGHTMWKMDFPYGYTSGTVFEVLIYVTNFGCNLPVSIWNTYVAYRDNTGKGNNFVEAIRPLWDLLAIIVLLTGWIIYSPTNILDRDPRAVYILLGTIFSNVTSRLIVAQMSCTKCDVGNKLFIPLFIAEVVGIFIPKLEAMMLYSICAYSITVHIKYGTGVVQQMCRHFKIDCFRIKYPN